MSYTSLHRFSAKQGLERVITPENSGCKHMGLNRILLTAGDKFNYHVTGEEMVLVLQGGDFTASVEASDGSGLNNVRGERKSVFDELPTAIYLPPGSKIQLETEYGMEARLFSAPCVEGNPVYFVEPKDLVEKMPGEQSWRRKYRFIFGPDSTVTKKLIVGESVSVPGGWVGFPAHKHDVESSTEYPLDEIFSFKLSGQGAYVIQHSFDLEENWNEYHTVNNDDCAVALPKGYHTSLVSPGCTYYLLWGLAGKTKTYKITFDARFDWLNARY
ncbi:MAG: 5-deoxy-glucuronate isomerase [Peptococcaceae bacterium]|nr:5-deoxy-glucuronate isomerase [Peptococcaceae bacterium]